jgi:hypothetical protein
MLVTECGDALIKNYRELERDFATLAARRLHPIIPTVIRHSKSNVKTSLRTKIEQPTIRVRGTYSCVLIEYIFGKGAIDHRLLGVETTHSALCAAGTTRREPMANPFVEGRQDCLCEPRLGSPRAFSSIQCGLMGHPQPAFLQLVLLDHRQQTLRHGSHCKLFAEQLERAFAHRQALGWTERQPLIQ